MVDLRWSRPWSGLVIGRREVPPGLRNSPGKPSEWAGRLRTASYHLHLSLSRPQLCLLSQHFLHGQNLLWRHECTEFHLTGKKHYFKKSWFVSETFDSILCELLCCEFSRLYVHPSVGVVSLDLQHCRQDALVAVNRGDTSRTDQILDIDIAYCILIFQSIICRLASCP